MKSKLQLIVLIILSSTFLCAQTDTTKTKEYFKAIEALQKKDTTLAITLFKESVKQNNDASSCFELAKLSLGSKTLTELNTAKNYIDNALDLDPKNINYMLLQADISEQLFWTERLSFVERTKAINLYERILELDSNNIEALYNLGRLM